MRFASGRRAHPRQVFEVAGAARVRRLPTSSSIAALLAGGKWRCDVDLADGFAHRVPSIARSRASSAAAARAGRCRSLAVEFEIGIVDVARQDSGVVRQEAVPSTRPSGRRSERC